MMNTIRTHHLSPALVVACVALMVALGGVSYAAGVLPKNSVGAAQLQKKAVTGAKLKKNAVTGAKVKNGSLLAADFGSGQLPAGPQGPKGDAGALGPVGPQGDPGATGSPGLSEVELVHVTATNNSPQRWAIVHPSCPDGKRVIAAGGNVSTALADEGKVILTDAFPLSNNAAKVAAEEIAGHTPGAWTLVGYATCAKVQ
jgi:hypothetical protein